MTPPRFNPKILLGAFTSAAVNSAPFGCNHRQWYSSDYWHLSGRWRRALLYLSARRNHHHFYNAHSPRHPPRNPSHALCSLSHKYDTPGTPPKEQAIDTPVIRRVSDSAQSARAASTWYRGVLFSGNEARNGFPATIAPWAVTTQSTQRNPVTYGTIKIRSGIQTGGISGWYLRRTSSSRIRVTRPADGG